MWGRDPTAVVVDDDPGCRELHVHWLDGRCRVIAAADGEEALATIDDTTDLVLLDREMPGLTGVEVLERLRSRGYGGYVVMITGVEPDFDLVETPVDDYLVKPITGQRLLSVVDRLATRADYHEQLRDLFSLAVEKARLEVDNPPAELHDSDEYERLEARLERKRDAVRRAFESEGVDWLAAFEACIDHPA